jgi:anthranilate synthase component II
MGCMSAPKVLLVDNYDSFTWNLVHEFGGLGAEVEVVRNDAESVDSLIDREPDAFVISPGPCTPQEAGVCLDLIERAAATTPIFGVCLGHQAIGQVFGGSVVRAPTPIHGKVATIEHDGTALFRGLNGPFRATRYHSLVVERSSMPRELRITAQTDGLVMAVSHDRLPVHGVQFHPESIASDSGRSILKNFLDLAADWSRRSAGVRAEAGAA